jgi:CubicO group peptidase (beta-lactamase class C family)
MARPTRKRPRILVLGCAGGLLLFAGIRSCSEKLIYARNLYRTEGGGAVVGWLTDHELDLSKPSYSWETADPGSLGIDAVRLGRLKDHLARNNTGSLIVMRDDRIIYEWYAAGNGPDKPIPVASLGKAITGAMALALALEDGRVSLDDPVSEYVPQWSGLSPQSTITIRQLARHTSGLEDVRLSADNRGWRELYSENRDLRFHLALARANSLFDPGTRYSYSGVGYYVLAYALTASLVSTPQPDVKSLLTERLMDPLGIPRISWNLSYGEAYDIDGLHLYAIGSGGSYSPRAIARLGQFVLHRGEWNGEQIISPEWIDALLMLDQRPPRRLTDDTDPVPAMGWWVNTDGFWPSVPRDACVGAGMGHQILLVVPSLDLVAVRLGGSLGKPYVWGEVFWRDLSDQFLAPLMRTIQDPPVDSLL